MSEYEPVFGDDGEEGDEEDLERVRELFSRAGDSYFSAPWTWLAWALVLPAAALLTRPLLAARGPVAGPAAVLLLWSGAVIVGGAVEWLTIVRKRRGFSSSGLASWVLRSQGNLSLIAVALSVALVWWGAAGLLPGLWLLLLGYSFYLLGGLSFRPLRPYGLLYQLAGAVALWPGGRPLLAFAAATFLGNLWMTYAVWRRRRGEGPPG